MRRLTVLLTRPEGRNEKLARELEALPFDVEIEPLIALEPLGDEPIDVAGYDWVVITSVTGARELRRRMRGRPRCVAAIGRTTADAFGGLVDLIPRVSTQEGLLAELPRPAGRVLFAGAADARRLLVNELRADFVALYRTRLLRPTRPLNVDLVVLASPSAARAAAHLGLRAPAVTIGPETTRAAGELGLQVVCEAADPSVRGLAQAVIAAAR
jgi:uroporphyrinogen-III synthase